ncbi:MAG: SulP family inorganic anion transporter [Pseudarcicella sp.]|nr:SulP family inorganic anion transporter [Pseudarcicella sp.]
MQNFDYYKNSFIKNDWKSGISVFLVALPLCLGIALASGAPLFAGIIAGIIGGIVIGALSGSEISVSGPAAGLTIIVFTAIKDLGTYQGFLVAVILAGVIQLAFGYLKGGKLSAFFPDSVIKGMLVAIGIVIILKQIPHALGDDSDFEGDFKFQQLADGENSITEVIRSFINFNTGAVIITLSCLMLMIFWNKLAEKKISFFLSFPSTLAAVLLGIFLNQMYAHFSPELYLGDSSKHMVAVPIFASFSDFTSTLISPDFSFLSNAKTYTVALTVAMVASLESLLSLEAADSIDIEKRISSGDKELKAQGIGNILSGFLGGLPVTSVVVRTSANVYSGGKTRMSAIFHGILLLCSVVLIPTIINKIPLAALAAVLLMVGYKLSSIKIFKKVFKEGYDQFIPFIVTILVVVFKDLLWGIAIGTLVGIIFVLRTNFNNAISYLREKNNVLIKLNKDISFMNKSQLKDVLLDLRENDDVQIDGSKAKFIDHDIFDILLDLKKNAKQKNITVEFKNVNRKSKVNINEISNEH